MADYSYVRYFPADFMRDTGRLSQAEVGAYWLLISEYYAAGKPLPDDNRTLARITRSDTLSDWLSVRSAVAEYFDIHDGFWFHKRCDEEIAYALAARHARIRGAEAANAAKQGAERTAERTAEQGASQISDLKSQSQNAEPEQEVAASPPAAPATRKATNSADPERTWPYPEPPADNKPMHCLWRLEAEGDALIVLTRAGLARELATLKRLLTVGTESEVLAYFRHQCREDPDWCLPSKFGERFPAALAAAKAKRNGTSVPDEFGRMATADATAAAVAKYGKGGAS